MTPDQRSKLYNALMRGIPIDPPRKGLEAATNSLGEMVMEDIAAIEPIIEEMITEALGTRFASSELVKISDVEPELIGAHSLMVDIWPDGPHSLIIRFGVAATQKMHQIHVAREYAVNFANFLIERARS